MNAGLWIKVISQKNLSCHLFATQSSFLKKLFDKDLLDNFTLPTGSFLFQNDRDLVHKGIPAMLAVEHPPPNYLRRIRPKMDGETKNGP